MRFSILVDCMAKIIVIVLIAAFAFTVNAQARPQNYASLSIGKTNTIGNLRYGYNLERGTNVGGALGFDIAPYTGAEVLLEQHWSKETKTGNQVKLKMIMAFLKFRPVVIQERYAPYAMIGGGYVRGSYGSRIENGEGYFLGIGSEIWMLSRLGLFIDWKIGKVKFSGFNNSSGYGYIIKLGVLAGF